jgi:putative transposase
VAGRINRMLGGRGSLWQAKSYDRIVRDDEHLYNVVQYIRRNPMSAGIPGEKWIRWVYPGWRQAGWGFADEKG